MPAAPASSPSFRALKRAADHSFHTGMPGIVASRRDGHRHHAFRPCRNDQVGVAAPDIDISRPEGYGSDDFNNIQFALLVEAPRERPGKARGHVLRHHDRPGKIAR